MIRQPHMKLAGVWVHSAEKAGRDRGELCGLDLVGIKATASIDEIIALKPDCVLYMPQGTDFGAICRMLAAGINIVSTRGEFKYPPFMDPAMRQRVEHACREGGSTIHSTGSSPGLGTEALPPQPRHYQGRQHLCRHFHRKCD